MSTLVLIGSMGFLNMLSFSAATGAQAPISWSPDSRWICYTVTDVGAKVPASPDWLFSTERPRADLPGTPPIPPNRRSPIKFRIWATQLNHPMASALLEESDVPLGSPSWRPDGRAIAFTRFIPEDREGNLLRGRFEVIVKEGLEGRKVIHAEENLEAEESSLAALGTVPPAWNRDGTSLAVHRAVGIHAILVMDARSGKVSRIMENASRPAWSPNGTRLAIVRGDQARSQESLVLLDNPFATSGSHARVLATEEQILQTPFWTSDGQSILIAFRKHRTSGSGRSLSPSMVLGRISAVTGEVLREWPLGSEPPLARGPFPQALRPGVNGQPPVSAPPQRVGPSNRFPLPGCRLDYHPETEELIYTTDQPGPASSVICQNLRTDITHKRFPALDQSMSIGSLAVSPDGRTLAIRFYSESGLSGLSPPAFCDIPTEALTIPSADDSIRNDWLSRLIAASESLLTSALPEALVPGVGIAQRPSLLPAAGELTPGNPSDSRIRRIGRIGRSLCQNPSSSAGEADHPDSREFLTQASFFFHYLAGDMNGAEASLNELEASPLTPRQRTSLLGMRSQILTTKGDLAGARAIIDYLTTVEPATTRTVEETPTGIAIADVPDPRKLWGDYLAIRHEELKKSSALQQRKPQTDETGIIPPRPTEMLEELNQGLPLRVPFIPPDPDARLFVDPPIFVRP